jgi:hypothetical protein
VAHLAAILFFSSLLLALLVLIEATIRAHWAEIASALGLAPVPQSRPSAQAVTACSRLNAAA